MIYIFGGAFDPPHVGHMAIVKSILAKKHPEKIIIIPSSARNDKDYSVADEHRLAMLGIFADEIHQISKTPLHPPFSGGQEMVIIDDYFVKNWSGEMITKDVDQYCREKYGEDIVHIFGTDTIESMPSWDSEGYAAKKVRKLFVPRSCHRDGGSVLRSSATAKGESDPENQQGIPYNDWIASYLAMTKQYGIENFELFIDCHIPDISSTELRQIIPEYTGLKAYFEENPKFIIPGLSKRISQYILEKRLYRQDPLGKEGAEGNEARDFVSDVAGTNFQSLQARTALLQKPRILVHICCGPDATMPILQLRDEYDVICFWYDPNIQPKSEYDKRYEAFVKVCEIENIPYIKGAYDVKNFFTRIKGVEHTPERGEKCTYCYDMRMMVSAKLAARLKIPLYTSSLNTSPKKDLEKLFRMGHKYAEKYGIEFLDIPFRKKGGFEKSVEYTKEHDIYRQNYCGCIYSIREGGDSEMKRRMVG